MANQTIVTNTDPSVDAGFPKVTGTTISTSKHAMDVSVHGVGNFLEGIIFDYISAAYPTSSSEVYTYKSGGSGGTTVATITVSYTDSTKASISSVART